MAGTSRLTDLDEQGSRAASVRGRWEQLILKAPPLGPWLDREVSSLRARLRGTPAGEASRAILAHCERALLQLEKLSPLAIHAIAATLDEAPQKPERAAPLDERQAFEGARTPSPEEALSYREVFLRHPGMALAIELAERALLPEVDAAALRLPSVPRALWLGHLRDACLSADPPREREVAFGVALNLILAREPQLAVRDLSLLMRARAAGPCSPRERSALRAALGRLPPSFGLPAQSDAELLASVQALAEVRIAAEAALQAALEAHQRRMSGP